MHDLGDLVRWSCKPCLYKLNRSGQIVDYTVLNGMVKQLITIAKSVTNDNIEINQKMSYTFGENCN